MACTYYPTLQLLAVDNVLIKRDVVNRFFARYLDTPLTDVVFISLATHVHLSVTAPDGSFLICNLTSPATHITRLCTIQRRWRKRSISRRLAFAMAWHHRLGADSALGRLHENCALVIGGFL